MKKILIFALFFYILTLIQTSFLIHFDILGVTPHLILISIVLLNFLEKPKDYTGLWVAGAGGFFLDLFSSFQFGVSLFTLIILAFLIKRILIILKEENIIYFIFIFVFAFVFYNLFSVLFNSLLNLSFPSLFIFNKLKIFEIIYNLIWGILGYFLVKLCSQKVLKK